MITTCTTGLYCSQEMLEMEQDGKSCLSLETLITITVCKLNIGTSLYLSLKL